MITDTFFDRVLRGLDTLATRLETAIRYVYDYLAKMVEDLIRLLSSLFIICLFYLPSVIFILLYVVTEWAPLLVIGIVWALLLTALLIKSKGK